MARSLSMFSMPSEYDKRNATDYMYYNLNDFLTRLCPVGFFDNAIAITTWIILVMFVLSFFGNGMILRVMSTPSYRSSSTSTFFTALALHDIYFAIRSIYMRLTAFLDYHEPDWLFKIRLLALRGEVANYLLICITVERILCVLKPLKIKMICTRVRARLAVLASVILIVCKNVLQQLILTYRNYGYGPCVRLVRFDRVPNGVVIFELVETIVVFLLPFSVIVVGTIIILVQLKKGRFSGHTTRAQRERSITYNLLAANFIFFVLHTPFQVLQFFGNDAFENLDNFLSLSIITLNIRESNHIFSFFSFFISGATFRAEVRNILSSWKENLCAYKGPKMNAELGNPKT